MSSNTPHISVLKEEVLYYLSPTAGKCYVDGTFGAGGHSRAILEAAPCKLIGIDRDPRAAEMATSVSQAFPTQFQFIAGQFSQMRELLDANNVTRVDGVLLDLGVSSMQLDEGERGFSFQQEGPLDMRMSQQGETAEELLRSISADELADALYYYGGERKSRRVAAAIVRARDTQAISTTSELAAIIHRALGTPKMGQIDSATRSFQGIRMLVNQELQELEQFLAQMDDILHPGGRVAIITFHSGEDAIVKKLFKQLAGKAKTNPNRYVPALEPINDNEPHFTLLHNKAIAPSAQEIALNPRARSAKLRVIEKRKDPSA